jgi:phosphatidylcholine synthase
MTGAMRPPTPPSRIRRLAAWAIHLLTASGAVWGLLSILAIASGRFKEALLWNLLAVLVDAFDGALARAARVREVLPEIDGTLLDNLVDYLNYVVVPAYLIHELGLLPPGLPLVVAGCICLTSAYQFTQTDAKTDDHMFTGFPSYWNVLAFYLLLTEPLPWIGFLSVAVFLLLVFLPVRWIYPNRTPELRGLTLAVTTLWGAALVFMLWAYPERYPVLVYGSLAYVPYYIGASLVVGRLRRARGTAR